MRPFLTVAAYLFVILLLGGLSDPGNQIPEFDWRWMPVVAFFVYILCRIPGWLKERNEQPPPAGKDGILYVKKIPQRFER